MLSKVKRCARCRAVKPVSCFHFHRRAKDLRHCYCKICNCQLMRLYNATHKSQLSAYNKLRLVRDPLVHRRIQLRLKYGLSISQFEELVKQQRGRCAICLRPERRNRPLSVDHCHKSKRIRGLLCSNCNTAIGLFHDSVKLITLARDYLKPYTK
jgi:hypothetical protein